MTDKYLQQRDARGSLYGHKSLSANLCSSLWFRIDGSWDKDTSTMLQRAQRITIMIGYALTG